MREGPKRRGCEGGTRVFFLGGGGGGGGRGTRRVGCEGGPRRGRCGGGGGGGGRGCERRLRAVCKAFGRPTGICSSASISLSRVVHMVERMETSGSERTHQLIGRSCTVIMQGVLTFLQEGGCGALHLLPILL